jgi:hypothetical protein
LYIDGRHLVWRAAVGPRPLKRFGCMTPMRELNDLLGDHP